MTAYSNSGSNAGRGFRYQDAVISFLALECWQHGQGSVVPEGNDDAEICVKEGIEYVQVKSRRERLGLYKQNQVRAHIREMWKRANAANEAPSTLVLILETGIQNDTDRNDLEMFPLVECIAVSDRLKNDSEAKEWLNRTSIRIVANPAHSSSLLIEERLKWESLYRGILFAAVQNRVGDASDRNGELEGDAKIALSSNEVERDISRLKAVLTPDKLPDAVRAGFCAAVDFVTPLSDPEFYTGVTVRPGHLAAGLVVFRPSECANIIATMERTRRAVVAAPSGSGKSALMWDAAQRCKHTVRWFEIHTTTNPDVGSILQLLDLLEPTADAPVGLVLDDVGQNGIEIWRQLSQAIESYNGLYLLGSMREEDLALLDAMSRPSVLRFPVNDELPQRIWQELKDQKKSPAKGWQEAWNKSNGLLLEYTHLLTQGQKLADTIEAQVTRRLNEKRDDELHLIRILSVVTQTGAVVDVERLLQATIYSADDLKRALTRLENEHVIRRVDQGRALAALHQLRSRCLAIASHDDLTHPYEVTLSISTKVVRPDGLDTYVSFHADQQNYIETIFDSFLQRFSETKSVVEFAAFLDGIDRSAMRKNANEWVSALIDAGISKSQAGSIALFALSDQEFPELLPGKFKQPYEDLQKRFHQDYRNSYLSRTNDNLPLVIASCDDFSNISRFVSSLYGCELPSDIIQALINIELDLIDAPLEDVVSLMEICTETCRTVACKWAKRVGVQNLANRILERLPAATPPRFFEDGGTQVVESNFVFSPEQDVDLDDINKQILGCLQALAPTAERVDTRIVTPDGTPFQIGEYELHRKTVSREWLVGSPRPRRIRRWNAEIGYALCPTGITEYLNEGMEVFDTAQSVLSQIIDAVVRGKKTKPALKKLEMLGSRAESLVRPPQDDDGAIGVSDLQSVSHFMAVTFLPRLLKLPDQAMALHSHIHSQIEGIDKFLDDEPWELLPQGPPKRVEEAKNLFVSLMRIIEYCDMEKIDFGAAIRKLRPPTGSTNLRKLTDAAERKLDAQCSKIVEEIKNAVQATGTQTELVTSDGGSKLGKRFFSVLILADVDLELGPIGTIAVVAEAVREKFLSRSFTIVPCIDGQVMPLLGIKGVDTWFPITDTLDEWKDAVELDYFSSSVFDAFEELTRIAFDISNKMLGSEITAATEELLSPMNIFMELLPPDGTENFEPVDFREFFELLCSDGDYARNQHDAYRGEEPSELILVLAAMRNDVAVTAIKEVQKT